MKQLFSLLLLLLLLTPLSFAQTNYKKGFVVTTGGDTLRGFIDYREWDLSPSKISFRTSQNSGTIQDFNPSNSRYFEVSGMEAYRSYEGPISMDKVDKNNLTYGRPDTTVLISRIFLNKHQDGPSVTLYSYKDDIKERFFILQRSESQPQELLYKRYLLSTNNAKVVNQRFYVGQLLNVARHQGLLTDKLQREIEAAAYNEQDLLRVVSKINGQSDEEVALSKGSKIGSRLFAGVALSRGTLNIEGENSFADVDENAPSYMPGLAFGVDVFLNKNVQKFILRLEANLNNASYHLQRNEPSGNGSYYEISYDVTQQTASFIPQFVYNLYNKENLQLYIGGGFGFNYSNYSKNIYQRKYVSPSMNMESVYETDNYKELLKLWSTYTLRAGVTVNRKYELSAMYVAPGVITRYTNYGITTGSMNLGVNYLFIK